MNQYIVFANHVLRHGKPKKDRTGTGTISYFGYQMRFDLQAGFPLLTTKKIHWKSVVHELLWFIKGDTNIRYLVQNGVRIWNEWPYQKFTQSSEYQGESLNEFVQKILLDENFAMRHGDLGPVYGRQWRNFNGVDQLKILLTNLKNDPFSRRHIISAWNPPDIPAMALPPCHTFMQFYVDQEKRLSCKMNQRSADIFLGVPFNIASYALLTSLIAHCLGYKPGEFIHDLGDCHVYNNHREQLKIQLGRRPKTLPTIQLNKEVHDLFAFEYDDIQLKNYYSWPAIHAEVSV